MAQQPEIYDPTSVADDEVAFDYIKSPHFQMVLADGAIGSALPNGLVHFALYGERPAIPRRQVYSLDAETGALGSKIESKTISRGSIVREMVCDVVMQPDVARSFAEWLTAVVDDLEEKE
ncbi:MAG: hypothetical protein AAFQ59_07595 [Pseudomonadota bacterium]